MTSRLAKLWYLDEISTSGSRGIERERERKEREPDRVFRSRYKWSSTRDCTMSPMPNQFQSIKRSSCQHVVLLALTSDMSHSHRDRCAQLTAKYCVFGTSAKAVTPGYKVVRAVGERVTSLEISSVDVS
jgi:hypothetical protein